MENQINYMPTSETDNKKRSLIYLFIIPFIIYIISSFCYTGFVKDDAYITYRYAYNLSEGHGLVFNEGETLEGYTNFLWVIFMVLPIKLGIDPLLVSRIISVIAGSFALYFTYKLSIATSDEKNDYRNLTAPICLATSSTIALWTMSGMENAILVMFITGGIYFMVKYRKDRASIRDIVLSGLFFALACLTRPEAHLITIYAGGLRLYWIIKDKSIRKSDFIWVGVILGVLVPYHMFRVIYFGKLLPNTYYIKGTSDFSDIFRIGFGKDGFYLEGKSIRLLTELIVFNFNFIFIILSFFSIFTSNKNKDLRLFYLLIMISFIIYIGRVGRDMMFYRLYIPALPFQMILAQEGLKNLYRLINKRKADLIRNDKYGWLGILQSGIFACVFLIFIFYFTNVGEVIDVSRTGDIRLGTGIFGVVFNFNWNLPLIIVGSILLGSFIAENIFKWRVNKTKDSKEYPAPINIISILRILSLLAFIPLLLFSFLAITKRDGSLLALEIGQISQSSLLSIVLLIISLLVLLCVMYINQKKHRTGINYSTSMNLNSIIITFIIIANMVFNIGFSLGYGNEFIQLLENSHGELGHYLNEHADEDDYVIFQDMGYTPWVARDIKFIDTIGIVNSFMGKVMPEYDYTPFFYYDKMRTDKGKQQAKAFREIARDYFFSFGDKAGWTATVLYTSASSDKKLKRLLNSISPKYIKNSNVDPKNYDLPMEEISDEHKDRINSIFSPFNHRNKYYYGLTHDSRFRQRYELITYWRGSYTFWVALYRLRDDWKEDIIQSELLLGGSFKLDLLPNAVVDTTGVEIFFQQEMYRFSNDFESYDQLLFTDGVVGDSVDIGLNIENAGMYSLILGMIEGRDFAKIQIILNDEVLDEMDFYSHSIKRKEVLFDGVYFKEGDNRLSFLITGQNKKAIDYRIGIDTIVADKH